MTPQKWNEVKEIFNAAVELSVEERGKFLDGRINGDAELRREVEKLLVSDEHAATLFDGKSLIAPKDFSAQDKIGNYQIVRKIGEGGMGAVFLAERADLKQRVALKIIRRGADSDVILKRFRREQEILAALEHPNIARLIDVGISPDGVPFLAMEYVEGADLTAYVARKNLSVNERLVLFRKICDAVSYAHSRLIVHRDLKPSNIIVSAAGEPKLLDFGISKLISETESAEEKGTVTSLGMLTPNYASPEQFRGETVSTSTDVYSLGVILFELLTNALPYEIAGKRIDEVARAVIETNPQKPSEAVGILTDKDGHRETRDEKRTTNSEQNCKSQTANRKSLRGDLDNIILKALRKEPSRRYFSVEQFSEDLRRHLAGLPVTARRDTFSYRAEKFIKRNAVSVVSAALVFLILIIGIAGISWQYVRAERQRVLAEKRFGEVRQMANNVVFKYYDEADKLIGSTKMREMMVTDALVYLDGLARDAGGDASLQKEIGLAYNRIGKVQGRAFFANLGDTKGAVESYEKGIGLLEPLIAKSDDTKFQWDFVNALGELSSVLRRQGNLAESDVYLRRATELGEKFLAANPDDPTLLTRSAYSYYFIGDTLPLGMGENENIAAFRQSIQTAEKVLSRDPAHPRANNIRAAAVQRIGYNTLQLSRNAEEAGDAANAQKLRDEAAAYYYRAIELGKEMVAKHPNDQLYEGILSAAKTNEADYLIEVGQNEKALQIALEGFRNYENKLRADPENSENKLNLTYIYTYFNILYTRLNQAAKAEASYATMMKIFDDIIARDPDNLDYRQKRQLAAYLYADELLRTGKIEATRKIYTEEYAAAEATARKKIPSFADSMRGFMFEKSGDCDYALVKQNNLTAAKRNELKETARVNYEQALRVWRQTGAQIAPGITDAGRIKIVERKLAWLQN